MKHKLIFKFLMVTLALFVTGGPGIAATFDMTGSYLNVGVSNTGGLVDDTQSPVGIQFDKTGTGTFPQPDILTGSGIPFEFYAVGINGSDLGPNGTANFFISNSNYTVITTQVAPLVASTAGLVGTGLVMTQVAVVSGKSILFNVNFFNISGAPMTVEYARGMAPDPDAAQFSFNTINSISAGMVTAVGPLTGIAISLVDLSGGGVPTIQAFNSGPFLWATDLKTLAMPMAAGNYGSSFFSSIDMYWNLGTLANDTGKSISFEYNLSAVPLPSALLLFAPGLLGLVGLRKRFFG
jgi:hypothetical protein